MKKTALVGALLLLTSTIFAQKEKINVAVLNFYGPSKSEVQDREIRSSFLNLITDGPDYNNMAQIMRQFQDYAIEIFLRDQRFVMVERAQISRIQEELELQKSEEFIDGFTVEQGQSLGADYLLLGDFSFEGYLLTLSLYSVADQTVVAKENTSMRSSLWADLMSPKKEVQKATRQLINQVFPPQIKLVRVLKGNKKAKEVLIAGGSGLDLKKRLRLLVKVQTEEEVDGEIFPRLVTIGRIAVEEIENIHFSRCSVRSGGSEIADYLASGASIYCTIDPNQLY